MAATLLVAVPAQAAIGTGASPELVVPADPVAPAVLADAVEPVEIEVPGRGAAAHAISSSGVVIGDVNLEDGALRPFRWQDGQAEVLTELGESSVVDVNAAGQVLVQTYRSDGGAGAYLWEPDGTVVDLAPEPLTAYGWDLDDAGRVALDLTDPGEWETHAAVWQDGTLTRLDDRGGRSYVGEAGALNRRGEVVGTIATDVGNRAVVWRNGVPTDLQVPPGAHTYAEGVNDHGDVLGSVQVDGVTRAVVWERGRVRYLLAPDAPRGRFYDFNERGTAVGSVGDQRETMQATLVDKRKVATLPTLGGTSGTAYAVNDHDVAVGATTTGPDTAYGQAVAWVHGAAVPLGGWLADEAAPVNSAALDIAEDGRAVGYVQRRDANGGLGINTRAVLWELSATNSRS